MSKTIDIICNLCYCALFVTNPTVLLNDEMEGDPLIAGFGLCD